MLLNSIFGSSARQSVSRTCAGRISEQNEKNIYEDYFMTFKEVD